MAEPQHPGPSEAAFERWVDAFRGPLVGLLASWGPDWRAAEELAQDTFAEAWLGRARFRGDPDDAGAVGAWLRGIAFHLHAAVRRRAGRGPRLVGDETLAAQGGGVATAQEAPEVLGEREERERRRRLLVAAFGRLSAPHQTVLRMHYLEETGTRAVAALLGITPKAVEMRLYQARKALRAQLEHVAPEDARHDAQHDAQEAST